MLLPAWELKLIWFAWTEISLGENLAKPTLSFDPAMLEVTFEKGPSSVAVSSFLILPLTDKSLSFHCWDFPPLLGQRSMVQGPCSPVSASQVSWSNSNPPRWLGGVVLLTYLGDSPQDKEAFWVSRNIDEHAMSID